MDRHELGIRPMSDMNKVMVDLSSGNFDDTIAYDDYKDYVFIGIRNVIRKYVQTPAGKVLNETTNRYGLARCDETNFRGDQSRQESVLFDGIISIVNGVRY